MTKWRRILYHPGLPLGADGKRVTACPEHIRLSREAAREGAVLLKNAQNILPFAKGTKLALFGLGTFDYVMGGGGSGDVTVSYSVDLYEGFSRLKDYVSICPELVEFYRDAIRKLGDTFYWPGQMPEPELPDEIVAEARAYTDTAVITISRYCGESWDRDLKGHPVYEEGDFYLTNREKAMVEKVKKNFPRIVVVLNAGSVLDTQWFQCDAIQGAMMAWLGGMEGGAATAELLCGLANPSGKLADTFAKRLEDYPSTENFHESKDYVDYTEDIYVGYRYFETIPGAARYVSYPFGYGLSYTEFAWEILSAGQAGENIRVTAKVENVGKVAGKEVLQLYASAPQGKLGKPARVLTAFQKTGLLQPGQSQDLVLEFAPYAMASYDDLGKVAKSCYVLEKGSYTFHVGNSIRNTRLLDYVLTLEEDQILARLEAKLTPNSLSRRLLADGSYEALTVTAPPERENGLPPQPLREMESACPVVRGLYPIPREGEGQSVHCLEEVADGKLTLDAFVEQLPDALLCHLLSGQPNLGVANTQGFGNVPEFGVPNAMTADGPAGVRIRKECGVYTTAFPCATQVCCSWDPELSYAIGVAGAKEMKENNLAAWLTPAINIHRNPQCGRNFEYYSEDPILTGVMAARFVEGVQSQKISACVKHFALNNKETNRKDSDSRVSERAAREIYLKAFEIVVKTAKPWYVMSSYNLINGVRASENRELCEDILRGEWGFDGMVSTDWHTHSEEYKEILAGNDLKMPAGFPARLEEALRLGLITRQQLQRSAKRILSVLLRLA